MIPPLLIKKIGQDVESNKDTTQVLKTCVLILLCYVLISGLRFCWRYFIILSSQDIETKLREYLYSKILVAKYSETSKLKIGDTVSLLSEDVNSIRNFMGPGILIIFDTLAYLIFIPLTLYQVLGSVSFIVLAPLALVSIAVYFYQKPVNTIHEMISTKLGKIADHVYEETIGAKIFKILKIFTIRNSKFEGMISEIFNLTIRLNKYEIYFEAFIQLTILFSFSIMFYFAYEKQYSLVVGFGAIAVSIQLLNKIVWPMMAISYVQNFYQMAKAASRRLYNLYYLEKNKIGDTNILDIETIEIKNLSICVENNTLLKNINLKFEKGKKYAIVGPVGSGKSFLLRILASLYNDNEISYDLFLVNGVDYKNLNQHSYRKNLSYVPQEIQVFSDSLKKNISFDQVFKHEMLMHSLSDSELITDLNLFTNGLDTVVGEKGINLSGGQKQRLSIARSFYQKANLYIWDDTISALDTKTESSIIKNIFTKNHDSLLILATHRLSSLKKFDQIIVVDQGQVKEAGSFDELLAKKSLFYELYNFNLKTAEI